MLRRSPAFWFIYRVTDRLVAASVFAEDLTFLMTATTSTDARIASHTASKRNAGIVPAAARWG